MDTLALGRFRRMLQGGDMQQMAQMFMGGGAGQSTVWVPRPGEAAAQRSGGGGRGAAAGAAAAAGITDPNVAFQIIQLLSPGGFGGGGGFRLPGAPRTQPGIVQPGDYVVSLSVGGKTLKRTLRVERASGTGTVSSFFEEEGERR
jgi:hypothetical protein